MLFHKDKIVIQAFVLLTLVSSENTELITIRKHCSLIQGSHSKTSGKKVSKSWDLALASMTQLVKRHPVHPKVVDLIPLQDTCPGFGLGLDPGRELAEGSNVSL